MTIGSAVTAISYCVSLPLQCESARSRVEETIQRALPSSTEPKRLGTPQDALLSDMELPLCATFYPLGFSVEIITNEPAVLLSAELAFGHIRSVRKNTSLEIRFGVSNLEQTVCPPEPTRRAFNHLYSLVADANNQAILDLRTCSGFAWLTKTAVRNEPYFRRNFLEKMVYLTLGASLVTDIHAACVSKSGKGILLCGGSGAGKSTLAYGCARNGWTYTSDDTSYLLNDSAVPRVTGHCHRVRFRPSAKVLFPELEGRSLTPRMEGKPSIEVAISELPVLSADPEAEVHFIVFLHRRPDCEGELIPMAPEAAVQQLCRELYSAGEIRARHEKILKSLSTVPAFELRYWDLDSGIRSLESLPRNA